MKIPFDVKFRPQIESGEYKVETREGLPVRIICWDRLAKKHNDDDLNLCVLIPDDQGEAVYYYHRSGKRWVPNDDFDLFIVTPEEEMTEWQRFISACLQKHGLLDCGAADRIAKESAAKLLSLAREQFIKDGYIIEKKIFHDAVEKVDSKMMKDVSMRIDFENLIHNLSERYPEVSFAKLTRIAKVAYQKGWEKAWKDL